MAKRRHRKHLHIKIQNIALLFIGICFAVWLARFEELHSLLLSSTYFSYFGVVLAGLLFVVSFTAPTGAVLLLLFAERFSAIEIGIIAAFGATLSDFLIFRFVRDSLIEDLMPLYEELGGNHLTKLLHTKYFSWSLPVIGAIILASPLPDELGVTLLGLSRVHTLKFICISFFLNAVGISLIVLASTVIKP
jgi:hypothetical protein